MRTSARISDNARPSTRVRAGAAARFRRHQGVHRRGACADDRRAVPADGPDARRNQSPFLIELGRRAKDRYGFNIRNEFGRAVPGDLGGYEPLGVARVQAIHSGPVYHTSGDTLDTISLPGLDRAAHFFAYFVSEAAKAPRSAINP
jgi:hypothetical protein